MRWRARGGRGGSGEREIGAARRRRRLSAFCSLFRRPRRPGLRRPRPRNTAARGTTRCCVGPVKGRVEAVTQRPAPRGAKPGQSEAENAGPRTKERNRSRPHPRAAPREVRLIRAATRWSGRARRLARATRRRGRVVVGARPAQRSGGEGGTHLALTHAAARAKTLANFPNAAAPPPPVLPAPHPLSVTPFLPACPCTPSGGAASTGAWSRGRRTGRSGRGPPTSGPRGRR